MWWSSRSIAAATTYTTRIPEKRLTTLHSNSVTLGARWERRKIHVPS